MFLLQDQVLTRINISLSKSNLCRTILRKDQQLEDKFQIIHIIDRRQLSFKECLLIKLVSLLLQDQSQEWVNLNNTCINKKYTFHFMVIPAINNIFQDIKFSQESSRIWMCRGSKWILLNLKAAALIKTNFTLTNLNYLTQNRKVDAFWKIWIFRQLTISMKRSTFITIPKRRNLFEKMISFML